MVSIRDLGLTLVLVVILVWSCPVTAPSSCYGEELWCRSRALDMEALAAANATVLVLGSFPAADRDACAELCCNNLSGNCTMASFQTDYNNTNDTCHLYNCFPSNLCFITKRNGTDTLMTAWTEVRKDTLKAVHGDGTQSKGRKGVLSIDVEDVPLKHDNTTVKPRKGVLKEHLVNTVKARKGVENETLEISTDMFSDDISSVNTSLDESVTPVTVGLQDVVTELSHFVNESTPIVWVQQIDNSSVEELTNMTIVLDDTTSPVPPTTESSTTELHTTTMPSFTRKQTFYVAYTKDVIHNVERTKSNTETPDNVQISDWEPEPGATSMHLVIGLVLGLMLLLTVLGIVAKRIHDSWQRRHYHRMDFLIDGMYHGEP